MDDSIGAKLKTARRKRGLSQAELAKRVGVSQAAVGQWERGEFAPRGKNIIVLNEILQPEVPFEDDHVAASVASGVEKSNTLPSSTQVDVVPAVKQSIDIQSGAHERATHRNRGREFKNSVEQLLREEGVEVTRSGIVESSSRRWVVDLSTDRTFVQYLNPINWVGKEQGLPRLLWQMAVMRECVGNQFNYIALVIEPPPIEEGPSLYMESINYSNKRVLEVMDDAEIMGIHAFVATSPEQAAELVKSVENGKLSFKNY